MAESTKDPSVVALQQQLQKAGYNKLPVTGDLDPATRSALADLNQKLGIGNTGSGTTATMQFLNDHYPVTPATGGSGSASTPSSGSKQLTVNDILNSLFNSPTTTVNPAVNQEDINKKTQDWQGAQASILSGNLAQAMAMLGADYNQALSDLNRSYEDTTKTMDKEKALTKEANLVDANRRGMFWGSIPNVMNDKTEQQYVTALSDILNKKNSATEALGREYQRNVSNAQMGNSSAVQQLALAAKDYANNLYNDEWNRQFQTSQANMQGQTQKLGQMLQAAGIIQDADQFEKTLSNSNFWNQKDLDYKNAVRTDSNNQFKTTMDYNYDKMAQDKDLTMYGINHQGSGGVGSNGLTVGQQLDMQDAVAGYKGGLLNMLTGYGMNPIRNQKDFDALNSNYSAANGYISTLPGYAQNEVRNFFNGSDWAKYYNSNKGWKPTAGSGGFFDTVFGAPPASGVKPPAKYPDIKK